MHRLTGHSGKASIHMSAASKQSIVPEYLPYVEPFFNLSTLTERLRHDDSVMLEYPVKDGNWHLARFIVQTHGGNGEAEQVLFAMRLYSEEKRREKDLMSAADAARRANEAKSEFLSCMSHDIRTPMNVIMGFTNITLQHADDPGKMKECLEKIQISGGNLQELIDDVLDISRIESGEFKIVSQPVKLPELFDFYCQAIAGMAEAKNIRFSGKLHDISHNVLLSDQIRLGQIYMNLLSNTVKYTPEKPLTVLVAKLRDHRRATARLQGALCARCERAGLLTADRAGRARRVRCDPDGHADAGDERPGGDRRHPKARQRDGEAHPHHRPHSQRLP